jgi:hypothetical protein
VRCLRTLQADSRALRAHRKFSTSMRSSIDVSNRVYRIVRPSREAVRNGPTRSPVLLTTVLDFRVAKSNTEGVSHPGACLAVLSLDARDRARAERQARVPDEGRPDHAGRPDHYARLAPTKHFRDFLMASRPVPKQPEEKRQLMTLRELEELLRAPPITGSGADTLNSRCMSLKLPSSFPPRFAACSAADAP